MKRRLVCLFLLFFYTVLHAQKDCRQNDYKAELLRLHPFLQLQYDSVELFTKRRVPLFHNNNIDTANNTPLSSAVPEKIVIPVVVHILWNNSAQNISDDQVLSQLTVLNADYSGTNADHSKVPAYFSALAADCGISFVLAKKDPLGNPTTGIIRKQTSVAVFNFDDKVKSSVANGDDAWNADSYLNIWVCNLEAGISGYASMPGALKENDGVVISTPVFGTININGPFNKGRTATHEIGHWLNLRHVWGDAYCGDDYVDDTPTQQAANRGCITGEKFTCGSTAHGDMYMNYMDFSDDACMYMFTLGQRARMRVLFEQGGARNAILSSTALNGNGLPLTDTAGRNSETGFDLLLYPNPAGNAFTLQLNGNYNCAGKKIYVYNHLGQMVMSVSSTSKLQVLNIDALPAGLYFVKVDGGNAVKKLVKQ